MALTRAILVLGSGGALGSALLKVAEAFPALQVVPLDKSQCDITERKNVDNAIRKFDAQVIVNAAAYTDVDGCERNPMLASAVNAEGAVNVAKAVHASGGLLIHTSTDFVFDGDTDRPYRESDLPNPLCVYGSTKLEGERDITRTTPRACIVRTAWTFGPGRDNFITKVIARARKDGKVSMFRGQTGSPTYTVDLAKAILALAFANTHGLFHVVNSGVTTRTALAKKALELAGLGSVPVEETDAPPPAADGQVAAKRPAYSALDASAFTAKTGIALPSWEDALAEYVATLPAA